MILIYCKVAAHVHGAFSRQNTREIEAKWKFQFVYLAPVEKKTKNVCFFTDGLFFFQTNKSQWAGRDNIWGYESSKAIKGPTLNEMSENMERVKRFLSQ